MTKRIAVLGSTGSIGTQTLDVVSRLPEQFEITGLAAGRNIELLIEQIYRFRPRKVSVADKQCAEALIHEIPSDIEVYYGDDGACEIAANSDADIVITAVVGSQGLRPTIAAIEAGKTIGLANKETLVSAGDLVTALAVKHRVRIIPVDSEHSAIFQCLNGESMRDVNRIILTASGGSFGTYSREQLAGVTVEDALRHPNWKMGAKITIDSATMVNKGLEVIEAHWLFDLPYDQIDVVIHPESIIHSMVEFTDTSVLAQMGNPDMRVPIQYALTYPERLQTPAKPLRLSSLGSLHFREMDFERFPCLQMAYECGRNGGAAPAVFNAANEVAVQRFLQGNIHFLQIEDIIAGVIKQYSHTAVCDLETILSFDQWARSTAEKL